MKQSNMRVKWILCLSGILAAVLTLFSVGAGVRAADDDFFLKQEIDVPGEILGYRQADFNGDSLTDLVIIVQEPDGGRRMRTYIQRQSGRFPPGAGQVIDLPPSANMAQCADVNGDGKSEFLIVDRNGMWQYRYEDNGFPENPRELVPLQTIFSGGIQGQILQQNFVHIVSGRPVGFLPVSDGFALYEFRGNRPGFVGTLQFPHVMLADARPVKLFTASDRSRARSGSGAFVMTIPEVIIHDDNKDGLDDVYLIWSDRLAIYLQDEQGRFQPHAPRPFLFQQSHGGNLCQSRLIDYDRDGRLDLVCSRSEGGISGAHTEIDFFGSDRIARNDLTQSYHISLTDACGNLMIDDFDSRGGPELAVPAIELGIMSTVKKMVSKKTDCHVLIYPIDNLGRPAREPQVRRKLTCRLNFELADPTSGFLINWSGDFNGDGLLDMVVADGGGQLMFYSGSAEEYLQDKTELVLDMPNPVEIQPVHLNNDGRSDLIILHAPGGGSTRMTLLVTNRYG